MGSTKSDICHPFFIEKKKTQQSYGIANLISTINFLAMVEIIKSTKTPTEVVHPSLVTQLRLSSLKPNSPAIIELNEGIQTEHHSLKMSNR